LLFYVSIMGLARFLIKRQFFLHLYANMLLVPESWHKGSNAVPFVDEETMTLGHWLALMLCVPFSVLIQRVGCQKDIRSIEGPFH